MTDSHSLESTSFWNWSKTHRFLKALLFISPTAASLLLPEYFWPTGKLQGHLKELPLQRYSCVLLPQVGLRPTGYEAPCCAQQLYPQPSCCRQSAQALCRLRGVLPWRCLLAQWDCYTRGSQTFLIWRGYIGISSLNIQILFDGKHQIYPSCIVLPLASPAEILHVISMHNLTGTQMASELHCNSWVQCKRTKNNYAAFCYVFSPYIGHFYRFLASTSCGMCTCVCLRKEGSEGAHVYTPYARKLWK